MADIVVQCVYREAGDAEGLHTTSADIDDGPRSFRVSVATIPHKGEFLADMKKRHIARVIEEAFEAGKRAAR